MTEPSRWSRSKSLLEAALDLPKNRRREFLEHACGTDRELLEDILRLLACEEEADRYFGNWHEDLALGTRVGPYRLTAKLGSGGMGAVYRAERNDDTFRRTVAIKILRPGAISDEAVRRFEAERQILASIDHPNIARLFDGGTSEDGRPFLVMELVEGVPLDVFCDTRGLTTRARLRLFQKICAAVNVAHQSLVVHRDLKPANILVTDEGEPKLLDFGIAKLFHPEHAAYTAEQTRAELRLMTPDYASPEQARGKPVTTASDVYSLGVVLYELLTGRTPHDLSDLDLLEMTRRLCDEKPPRPSARVEGAARRRLQGDLDNIVLKALSKEPKRRYASVTELSDDVERHIRKHPVRARADTFTYRAGRFVERHRVGLGLIAIATLTFTGFTVLTVRARTLAEHEAAKTRAVNQFLQEVMSSANVARGGSRNATMFEALEAAGDRIDSLFDGRPELESAVRHSIGMTLVSVGEYEAAEAHLLTALAKRRDLFGARHPDVAQSRYALGVLYFQRGDFDRAVPELEEAVALQRELLGRRHPEVAMSLHILGLIAQERGELQEAGALYDEVLEIRRQALGDDHPLVGRVLTDVARLAEELGDDALARARHREAVDVFRRSGHPELGNALDFFAGFLTRQKEYERAAGCLSEAERLHRERGENLALSQNRALRARLLAALGQWLDASACYREAIELAESSLDPAHPHVTSLRSGYSELLADARRHGKSIEDAAGICSR